MTTLRALASATLAVAGPPAALASPDHWIYDADVVLYDDFDNDGYHHFLSVRIDADSLRRSTWVFAELYLSPDGVRWEHFYSTDDFWIGGQTGDDEFFIETELQSGYPKGYYDLLVELYDADFLSYSDEFGPDRSDGMALLPLEDASQDLRPTEIVIVEADGEGGGGASSWLLTPALLAAGWPARRRFRKPRISGSCAAG